MKVLLTLLIALLLALQYRLWFGRGNLMDVRNFEEIKQQQIEKNAKLQERNQSLAAEVLDLKKGLEAIEEKARSEMGMIREGETFYQIIEQAPDAALPVEKQ